MRSLGGISGHNRRRVVEAAEHALTGDRPIGLFITILGKPDWTLITNPDSDRAGKRLEDFYAGKPSISQTQPKGIKRKPGQSVGQALKERMAASAKAKERSL